MDIEESTENENQDLEGLASGAFQTEAAGTVETEAVAANNAAASSAGSDETSSTGTDETSSVGTDETSSDGIDETSSGASEIGNEQSPVEDIDAESDIDADSDIEIDPDAAAAASAALFDLVPISPIPVLQRANDSNSVQDLMASHYEVGVQLNNAVSSLFDGNRAMNRVDANLEEEIGEFYGFADDDGVNDDDDDSIAGGNANIILDEELNSVSTTNSNMSLADTDSDAGVEVRPQGRWYIPQHHVNEAIGELISQAQRTEGGIAGLIDRDNFMQRVRSMIFSMERTRNRQSTQSDGSGDGGEQVEANNAEPVGASSEADSVDEVMQSQSVNDNVVENEFTVRFDTNLPAEHSYFGPNSNRVPGVNYLDVGNRYRMLIFMHQHLLFPGEVLPFMINGSIIDEEEENSALGGRDGIIFGVVFPFLQETGGRPLKLYGVTCQIYERGEGGREMVFFKSRALQRFVADCDELQGPPQYIVANPKVKCYGIAKILPETYLPEPLNCINMGSMNRFRDDPSMRDKFKRFQAATTPWPAHIYNDYNISDIITKAREKLEKHKVETMPTCPTQLSFWLVRNLHLTEKLMHSIFMTDSVNVRLKMIGRTFKGDSLFFCRYCNNSIAQCHELFAMSKYGVQSQYCNSAGYIHETNTVYRLLPDSVTYNGSVSTEFSWFPGYQWRILVCKFCSQHIGWEYKAIEPNLVPKVFFGLAGTSVRVGKANSPATSNNMRPFVYRNLLRLVSRQME